MAAAAQMHTHEQENDHTISHMPPTMESLAIALKCTVRYIFTLLECCAPEMLRADAAHNVESVINDDYHRVILPRLHDVVYAICNRNNR
jgi:hypothetical protein